MSQKFEQRESGLILPQEKPKPPQRTYRPLEIQDEEQRLLAREALLKLWDAMDLSRASPLMGHPSRETYEAWYKTYRFVGEMILGDDCPDKEVYC